MSYLFLYEFKSGVKWGPSQGVSDFDFKVLDNITVNYEYHALGFYSKPDDGHYLHKIAKVALDHELLRCGILQIDDDFKALTFRMRHEEFLIGQGVKLTEVYDNPDFEQILKDCPIITQYVDRSATKKEDSKYVTKVANAVAEVAYNVRLLNGALGDDFEEQFKDLAALCGEQIAEYKENIKNNASNLTKERKLIRKRLAAFKAKEL
jgi:hypothetical protein